MKSLNEIADEIRDKIPSGYKVEPVDDSIVVSKDNILGFAISKYVVKDLDYIEYVNRTLPLLDAAIEQHRLYPLPV